MERSMGSRKQHTVKTMKKEFRVWCHRTKSWLHNEVTSTHVWSDYSIDIFNGKLYEYVTNDGEHFYKHKDDSEFTIHLWTGLYDKNGKKIFEGDILRHEFHPHNKNFVMKWNVLSWELFDTKEYGDEYIESAVSLDVKNDNGRWTVDELVVIGNTFENPELLKA